MFTCGESTSIVSDLLLDAVVAWRCYKANERRTTAMFADQESKVNLRNVVTMTRQDTSRAKPKESERIHRYKFQQLVAEVNFRRSRPTASSIVSIIVKIDAGPKSARACGGFLSNS